MTKRLIISTTGLTKSQESELKDSFQGALWWHRLPGFWLVADRTNELTTTKIADEIHKLNPNSRAMVLEVNPVTWTSLLKEGDESEKTLAWMVDFWNLKK